MRNFKLFALFCLIVSISSCQKDQITVNLKQSGNLNVQIADSTGKNYSKIKVGVYSYALISNSSTNYLSGAEIDKKTTDNNGNINFGEFSEGNYILIADTIKIGTKKYYMVKPVQIISGSTKSIKLNPTEYVGTIKINISLNTNGATSNVPLLNTLKVALVNYSDYSSSLNRPKVINRAVDIQKCDLNGNAVFNNIPSYIPYNAYVYIDNTDTIGAWCSSYSELIVDKDGTLTRNYQIDLGSIYIIRGTANINFNYYSYNSGQDRPVQNANVLFVKYIDYYNYNLSYSSLSTILNYKVASGITDNSGNVSISGLAIYSNYYILIYNDNYKTWAGSYYISSSDNYSNFNISGSSLGLTK
jgi:hypothetical protein